MNVTDFYISELREFSRIEITDAILHQVKRCLLDYIGVAHAGVSLSVDRMHAVLQLGEAGPCTVLGSTTKTDIYTAATVNGFTAHVIELDDGHRFAMLHLGAPIITAMLAVAQKEKMTCEQFVRGILIGYEAEARLAMAMQPNHKQRGFHATGTCGAVGVACAVAFALGLNDRQLKGAISAAATSAAGLLQVIDDASELKPYNVSHAAAAGIMAAYMGKSGFAGPEDVLGGKRGFLRAFTDTYQVEKLAADPKGLAIERIYVKPYAACRHCHAPIECALKIGQTLDSVDSIAYIVVKTYKLAVYGHDQTKISGVSEAKMSTPYCVAAALMIKSAGMEAFSESNVGREDILQLCSKVSVEESPELTALSPAKRGAFVQVVLQDGTVLEERVEHPLGEPENRISDAMLDSKYSSLMHYAGVPEERIEEIRALVWSLNQDHFEALLQAI